MIHHDYFGEIVNTTGTLWQNYLMIDKMPVAVSLMNNSKIVPTNEGLNRYAFACQNLNRFDENNRDLFFETTLINNDTYLTYIIDDSDIVKDWANYRYSFIEVMERNIKSSDTLPLQNIIIQFEGNATDGFIQFNYKVYPHLPDEVLWVQTDLTGTILNSVWENPYESLNEVGLLDK